MLSNCLCSLSSQEIEQVSIKILRNSKQNNGVRERQFKQGPCLNKGFHQTGLQCPQLHRKAQEHTLISLFVEVIPVYFVRYGRSICSRSIFFIIFRIMFNN